MNISKKAKTLGVVSLLILGGCSSSFEPKLSNGSDKFADIKDKNGSAFTSDVKTVQDYFDELYNRYGTTEAVNWVVDQIVEKEDIKKKRKDEIETRLNKQVWSQWFSNTSYYFDDKFYEKKLVSSLRTSGYELTCNTEDKDGNGPFFIDDVRGYTEEDQKTLTSLLENQGAGCDYSKIYEKVFLNNIYQDLVLEEFIVSDLLPSLKKETKVRKLKVYTINLDDSTDETNFLAGVNKAIGGDIDGATTIFQAMLKKPRDWDSGSDLDIKEDVTLLNDFFINKPKNKFETYDGIWKKYQELKIEQEIYKVKFWQNSDSASAHYYAVTDKKAAISKYTDNNKHSIETGKQKAILDIKNVKNIVEELYSKDTTIFSEPVKAILFEPTRDADLTAPADNRYIEDVPVQAPEAVGDEPIRLLRNMNNLKGSFYYQTDNSSSKAYFIQIVDLLSDDNNNQYEYAQAKAGYVRNLKVRAFSKYFTQLDIKFGDTELFDYFKETYPDYFDPDYEYTAPK